MGWQDLDQLIDFKLFRKEHQVRILLRDFEKVLNLFLQVIRKALHHGEFAENFVSCFVGVIFLY